MCVCACVCVCVYVHVSALSARCSFASAEGYDGRVLIYIYIYYVQVDLETLRPLLVQVEADHLSQRELRQVIRRFAANGFLMRTFGGDLLAYRPSLEL